VASLKTEQDLLDNPELFKRLVRSVSKNPNLTDVADENEVHPRTLALWVKKGLYPNPEPHYAALARAARKSRALLRGKLFTTLVKAAETDPKWAAYCMERLDEEGELTWQSTIPGPEDRDVTLQHLFKGYIPAEVLAAIDGAGLKLVPLEPGERAPLQITEGELVDEE
jgi:hypothetical protein